MKLFYLVVLGLLGTGIAIFVGQNLDHQIAVKFLQWGGDAPAALVILGVYIAGALSGAALFTFVRRAVNKITADPELPPGAAKDGKPAKKK